MIILNVQCVVAKNKKNKNRKIIISANVSIFLQNLTNFQINITREPKKVKSLYDPSF